MYSSGGLKSESFSHSWLVAYLLASVSRQERRDAGCREVLETTTLLDIALPLVSYHRNQVRGGNPLEKMALLHFCVRLLAEL